MKKRRRGPNDPVTAEELEWLRKEYNMDHTFRKLSELTGVHRDPVTLAEIPPETIHIHPGKEPESGYMPEHVLPETGYMPEHIVPGSASRANAENAQQAGTDTTFPGKLPESGYLHPGKEPESGYKPERVLPESGYIPERDTAFGVGLAALRNNPLVAWRQVPMDLVDRIGQIITGEQLRVDWNKTRSVLLQERITGNCRLVLTELFQEADRLRSFYLYFDFSELRETMGIGNTVLQRIRNYFRQPNPFVKGIDSVSGRGSFLQLADTFFIRGDRLDLIEKESFLLSPPKEVLGEMNFSREWEAKRQFRYYLAGLPVANSEQDDFLFSLEKRFAPDAWPRRGGLRDVSPLDAPMRNAMQAGTLAIWEIIQGRRPDTNDPVRNPAAYLRKCLEKHGGDLLVAVIQKNDLERWKGFLRIADTAFTGHLHQLDEESLALLANKLGVERRGGAQTSLKEHVEGLERILEKTREVLKRQIRL